MALDEKEEKNISLPNLSLYIKAGTNQLIGNNCVTTAGKMSTF